MAMSYYKFIEGKQYDRRMIETADAAIALHPGNFIEIFDAIAIWEAAEDGDALTDTEIRTLDYLQTQYKWTDAARSWIDRQTLSPRSGEFADKITQLIRKKHKLEKTQWIIDESEILLQRTTFPGKIPFIEALDRIITSYLEDQETGMDSIKQMVQEVHQILPEDYSTKKSWSEALDWQLRVYMESAYIYLVRYSPNYHPEQADQFEFTYQLPPGGESITYHWIFGMCMPFFNEQVFWGVVDRKGIKPAYHYEIK